MKKLKVVCMVLLTTLWICGCEEKVGVNLKEQLELGQRYLQEMDYENAIIAFQKMIEIDPKALEAYEGLAEAYLAIEEKIKALEILEKGIGIYEVLDDEEKTDERKGAYEALEKIVKDIENEIVSKEMETEMVLSDHTESLIAYIEETESILATGIEESIALETTVVAVETVDESVTETFASIQINTDLGVGSTSIVSDVFKGIQSGNTMGDLLDSIGQTAVIHGGSADNSIAYVLFVNNGLLYSIEVVSDEWDMYSSKEWIANEDCSFTEEGLALLRELVVLTGGEWVGIYNPSDFVTYYPYLRNY